MSGEVAVAARGLRKRYASKVALDALDLEVRRGTVHGLVGPNGAGKTTTFGILCGWLRATGGDAKVLGVDVRHIHTLRGKVAALPQDARFPSQVAVHSQLVHYGRLVGLSRVAAAREADQALERVGLADIARARGHELSHGMSKRAGLAQALIGDPELVFLDEPLSGLDPKTARHIKDLIAGLAPRATVVLSSHHLGDVEEICSDGSILDHGRLARSGPMDALTRRGSEVAIELGSGAPVPLAALEQRLGAANVSLDGGLLRIALPGAEAAERQSQDGDAVEATIREVLRLLLDAEVTVVAVRRGTSLESAFLEATAGEDAPPR